MNSLPKQMMVLLLVGVSLGCGGEKKPQAKANRELPKGYVEPQSTENLPLHDNPEFTNWKRFKVGTIVIRRRTTKNTTDHVIETQSLRLHEVGADKIVVENQITVERPNYPTKINDPFKVEFAAKFRLPNSVSPEQFGKPSIKATQICVEPIKVLGKDYMATRFQWDDQTESGPMSHTFWESMDFPGRMLRHEALVANKGSATTEEIMEVVLP